MAWISFGALPCRRRGGDLMTAHVSMLLKSRASLTGVWASFLPGRAKDLSAPRYSITDFWVLILPGVTEKKRESSPEITVSIFHLYIRLFKCLSAKQDTTITNLYRISSSYFLYEIMLLPQCHWCVLGSWDQTQFQTLGKFWCFADRASQYIYLSN